MRKPEYLQILIIRTFGNFLLLSSLFLIGKTFYQPVREEFRYFVDKQSNKQYVVQGDLPKALPTVVPKGLLSKTIQMNKIEILRPEDPNFSIIIPKIGANSRILPSVDVTNESVYLEALKKGVAHAAGTAYPGEGGHVFLFAHSTDYFWNVGTYNAVFYLLGKLTEGDEIDLFYQGRRNVYKVIGTQIVDPSQVDYLTRKTNKEFLTLQTCWPPGTTLKRLLVFATRKVE